MTDPADPRVMEGRAWDELVAALARARRLVWGDGVPGSAPDRAEGLRYLTRFLAAGISVCVELADADHPAFGRMIDRTAPWGLDCPDCLYLYASLRGDARYRIFGNRGTANHLDVQVNRGHFASGDLAAWGTIASCSGLEIQGDTDGSFELQLGGEPRFRNWLPLAPDAAFVLVRQYFGDWENERPADLMIERLGAVDPVPTPRTDQIAARIERLVAWLDRGGSLWEQMSRGLLAMPPNSLVVHRPEDAGERAGLRGQAYGMGNFHCEPEQAVIVEFEPPNCRHWSVALANYYWEAIEYGSRQSSLNGHQAVLDRDGRFRGVIAHVDPGVPNWLDPAGHRRGTIAARFLLADAAPSPTLRSVPLASLVETLPSDTPRVEPAYRAALLARRRRAVWRRFRQ
jgi:hypothetical protein